MIKVNHVNFGCSASQFSTREWIIVIKLQVRSCEMQYLYKIRLYFQRCRKAKSLCKARLICQYSCKTHSFPSVEYSNENILHIESTYCEQFHVKYRNERRKIMKISSAVSHLC